MLFRESDHYKEKKDMKLSNEKTNKFDRGQNMNVISSKIENVVSSVNLVLPALSAVLLHCFLSPPHYQCLFFILNEPLCCNSAARHTQKEICIIHLLSTAQLVRSAGEQTGFCAVVLSHRHTILRCIFIFVTTSHYIHHFLCGI